jgi:hypothetical protein
MYEVPPMLIRGSISPVQVTSAHAMSLVMINAAAMRRVVTRVEMMSCAHGATSPLLRPRSHHRGPLWPAGKPGVEMLICFQGCYATREVTAEVWNLVAAIFARSLAWGGRNLGRKEKD